MKLPLAAAVAAACLLATAPARPDGGTLRLRGTAGPFLVTVFTSPEPLRVGPADMSVLVQERDTGAVVLDPEVWIALLPPPAGAESISIRSAESNSDRGAVPVPTEGEASILAEGTESAPVQGTKSIPVPGADAIPAEGAGPISAGSAESIPVEGAEPIHGGGVEPIRVQATAANAANKLFQAARFDLPRPGLWTFSVTVRQKDHEETFSGSLPVETAAPRLLALWPWLALPPVGIALFACHQVLRRRRARTAPD